MSEIRINRGKTEVAVDTTTGELSSLIADGTEFIHDGQRPGWGQHELVAWPIFGPANQDGKVTVRGREFPMDQHGISRSLEWDVVEHEAEGILLAQDYDGRPVKNIKFIPEKGNLEYLQFLPARIEKGFVVEKKGLLRASLSVKNTGTEALPYNIGWHPAFGNADESEGDFYDSRGKHITTLTDLLQNGPMKLSSDEVSFSSRAKGQQPRTVSVYSSDMNEFVLWSPHMSMFCIEPMANRVLSDRNYFGNGGHDTLEPAQEKSYDVSVEVF